MPRTESEGVLFGQLRIAGLIILMILAASGSTYCQVYYVHQGYCKKKDIKIVTGDSIPKGFAVLQSGSFKKEEVSGTIEGLTKKQIREMKMFCHWRRCCEVFVAFSPVETFESYPAERREKLRSLVHFYVLAPSRTLDSKK